MRGECSKSTPPPPETCFFAPLSCFVNAESIETRFRFQSLDSLVCEGHLLFMMIQGLIYTLSWLSCIVITKCKDGQTKKVILSLMKYNKFFLLIKDVWFTNVTLELKEKLAKWCLTKMWLNYDKISGSPCVFCGINDITWTCTGTKT